MGLFYHGCCFFVSVFYPAAKIPSFPFFLAALIVLATGNHHPSGCGKPLCSGARKTADCIQSSDSNSSIQFLGHHDFFPWIGAHLILGTTASAISRKAHHKKPMPLSSCTYISLLSRLTVLAIAIGLFKLPEIKIC